MGSNVFPNSSMDQSKYWYNTNPNNPDEKRPTDFKDSLPECEREPESNYNLGAIALKSLNEINLGERDAYYFKVDINSIPWLTL